MTDCLSEVEISKLSREDRIIYRGGTFAVPAASDVLIGDFEKLIDEAHALKGCVYRIHEMKRIVGEAFDMINAAVEITDMARNIFIESLPDKIRTIQNEESK